MPKVNFVKKAQKAKPEYGIAVGDSYYWWSLMQGSRGVKHYSKTPPSRSQLTNSEFLQQLYSLQDSLAAISASTKEEFYDEKQSIIDEIENLRSETEDKLNNMPDGLQQGSTGELLQERIDGLQEWMDELDQVECDYDEDELRTEAEEENVDDPDAAEVALQSKIEEKVQEALENLHSCECSL